jgi:hypothetical protein
MQLKQESQSTETNYRLTLFVSPFEINVCISRPECRKMKVASSFQKLNKVDYEL